MQSQPRTPWWRSATAAGLYGAIAGTLATLLVGGAASWQAERTFYAEQRAEAYGAFLSKAEEGTWVCPPLVEAAEIRREIEEETGSKPPEDKEKSDAQGAYTLELRSLRARVSLVGSPAVGRQASMLAASLCYSTLDDRDPDDRFDSMRWAENRTEWIWLFERAASEDLRPSLFDW